jgi:ribosomal protein S8
MNAGVFLINTTMGVLSIQEAKKFNIGGFLMFYIL